MTPRWTIPSEPLRDEGTGCGAVEREVWPLPVEAIDEEGRGFRAP